MPQNILSTSRIDELRKSLIRGDQKLIKRYEKNSLSLKDEDLLVNPEITPLNNKSLIVPKRNNNYDFENAKILYEKYQNLNLTQATDHRLWAYLAHIEYGSYMQKRYPISRQSKDKKAEYILEHWFLNGISPSKITRHGIALLWWGANTTHDESREDPYELTREFFSMLDYTRTITAGTQGRYKEFAHAVLEFVIENKDIFSNKKELKVRYLMRKLNEVGGFNLITALDKTELKELCLTYKNKLKSLS